MKIRSSITRKKDKVSALSEEIKAFKSFLVFEYLGFNAEEISGLRKSFRESGSKLIVHTNNVLNRTFQSLNLKFSSSLKGPNAILLVGQNMKPFNEVVKLSKEKDFLKLKLAYLDNEIVENEDLNLLVSIGSREDMLVKVARTLLSPVYKLLYLLKNVKV